MQMVGQFWMQINTFTTSSSYIPVNFFNLGLVAKLPVRGKAVEE